MPRRCGPVAIDRPGAVSRAGHAICRLTDAGAGAADDRSEGDMRGKMDCHGVSDVGRRRAANEGQFLIADLSKSMLIHQTSLSHEDHTRLFGGSQGKLLLVADGMGGHAEGKRASSLAVQTMAHYVLNTMHWFFRLEEGREADLHEELKTALEECQRSIETAAAGNPERARMGTTLTMAYILWPRLYAVHAGD